jgi:hypothetical protein
MAYAGLDTLYQNMGPMGASYIAGQREASAREAADLEALMQAENIRKARQAYSQAEQINPLEVEQRRWTNRGLQEGLPGITAESRKKATEATKAEKTMSSDIAAKISTNKTNISEQQFKYVSNIGKMAGALGTQLEGAPPLAHNAVKMQFMQQNGIDPSSREGQYIMQNGAKELQDIARKAVTISDDYVKSISQVRAQGEEQRKLEQMRIEAGKYNKTKLAVSIEERLLKAKTPVEKAEILEEAFYTAMAGNDQQTAAVYRQRAMEARQRAAEDARNRGIAAQEGKISAPAVTGLPAREGTAATAPIAGGGQTPQAPAVKHKLSDVQQMYPGVPAEKIREAYKRKFGVDLQ